VADFYYCEECNDKAIQQKRHETPLKNAQKTRKNANFHPKYGQIRPNFLVFFAPFVILGRTKCEPGIHQNKLDADQANARPSMTFCEGVAKSCYKNLDCEQKIT
jgi:hypothetical protein